MEQIFWNFLKPFTIAFPNIFQRHNFSCNASWSNLDQNSLNKWLMGTISNVMPRTQQGTTTTCQKHLNDLLELHAANFNSVITANSSFRFLPILLISELLIPGTANVYYAINTQYDLNFVLREKPEDLNVSLASSTPGAGLSTTPHHGVLGTGSLELSGTPKGLRKPSRDNSKARRKILGLAL